MFKKLSVAGLALIASTGIAFADTSDTMPAADSNATSDVSASTAVSSEAATPVTHKKHKKHKKHRHHKRAHHVVAPADPVTESAPRADYKGEVQVPAPCPACHNSFMAGPYLGFSVGSLVNYTSEPNIYNGLQGTLLGGYGMLWDQWYGALEIFVQNNAQIINYSSGAGTAKSTWGYGLSVLPGYTILDNLLGYLRLGVVETRFSTRNSWVTGGQVGLGLDSALCNNWDLRGEYIYSFYNSIGNGVGNPKSQQFNLGLVYKFEM